MLGCFDVEVLEKTQRSACIGMVIGVATLHKHQFGLVAKKKFHIHKIVVVYKHFFDLLLRFVLKKDVCMDWRKKRNIWQTATMCLYGCNIC